MHGHKPQGPALTGQSVADQSDETLYSIQYLRAVAAYLVVAFHISASLDRETGSGEFFAIGEIGVDIFFVVSGFLMAKIVDENRAVNFRFLVRRFVRIAPLYYVMTLVLFAIALAFPAWLNTERAGFWHLITSLAFLPYLTDDGAVTPILSLGWTLNYEMFFYVLIALTTRLFGDRTLMTTVMILIGLAMAGRLMTDPNDIVDFYTDPIILEFAAGVLIYRYGFRDQQPRNLVVVATAFVASVFAWWSGFADLLDLGRFVELGLPASLIVAGGVYLFSFRAVWLERLGDWSYSTYLIHLYLIQLAVKLIAPAGLPELLAPWPMLAIILPATIIASAALYYGFEQPVRQALKGVGARKNKLAAESAVPAE